MKQPRISELRAMSLEDGVNTYVTICEKVIPECLDEIERLREILRQIEICDNDVSAAFMANRGLEE